MKPKPKADPSVKVITKLTELEDTEAAANLFAAMLEAVEKVAQRKARERAQHDSAKPHDRT